MNTADVPSTGIQKTTWSRRTVDVLIEVDEVDIKYCC